MLAYGRFLAHLTTQQGVAMRITRKVRRVQQVSFKLVVLCSALLATGGCVFSPRADDSQWECPPGRPFDPDKLSYPSPSPVLKVIELTDQGALVNRCQWTDALYELRGYGGSAQTPQPPPRQPVMTVMYIHGWKHNASEKTGDRRRFMGVLEMLDQHERASTKQPRRVVGIYVAWPGKTTGVPGIEELTFWSRQRAADRISQSGIVTKLVGSINSVRRQRAEPRDFTVFIGHSFGARVLYTGTSQVILHDVQMQHPGQVDAVYGTVRGPADLMILLNPAFGASAYTALDSIRRAKEHFWKPGDASRGQLPLLLTISADNDWATSNAFPLGQWLTLNWHKTDATTLGNWKEYVTHDLVPGSEPRLLRSSLPWYDTFCYGRACLVRREGDRQLGNPFLVARSGPPLLNGHNGIWDSEFVQWLGGFIFELDRQRY